VILIYCPHCGFHLKRPLVDGISSCTNCKRVFDSSYRNQLLSGAWLVRRRDISDVDSLIYNFNFEPDDADFVVEHVAESYYSHEDFIKLLDEQGITPGKKKAS
jgi:hypothetical protein